MPTIVHFIDAGEGNMVLIETASGRFLNCIGFSGEQSVTRPRKERRMRSASKTTSLKKQPKC